MIEAAADVWGVVAAIASVVAALSALATVVYARSTVQESRRGRREATEQHRELVEQQQEMTAAAEATRRETVNATNAAIEANRREREAAERALNVQITLRRIQQVDRISRLLGDLADTARDEWAKGVPIRGTPGLPLSRLPLLLAQLRVALQLLARLAGPELVATSELASRGYPPGTPPAQILGDAGSALSEVETFARSEPRLGLQSP